jgi:S-DNA-T family DNA segregation ATPase FtsK/SpoIIIE
MEHFFILEENIAHLLRLTERPIISPIYERAMVAIDAINTQQSTVELKEILQTLKTSDLELPLVLGRDIYKQPFVVDLIEMPHLLVAGTTGSGKSVGLRSMIAGLLHFRPKVELILVDPKRVEFSIFKDLPTCSVISETSEVLRQLQQVALQVEERYVDLAERGLSNIADIKSGRSYVVIVIDELADLFAADKQLKTVLLQIAQKSRAAGVHIIAATQRPSVDIVSGVIKNNFPGRIAYKVSSYEDSRTILGSSGAEKLRGRGDMLFRKGPCIFERIQGPHVINSTILNITTRKV